MTRVDSAIERLVDFRVANVYTVEQLRDKLRKAEQEKRPLRVKLGVDPTAPDIHLGHTVALRKMRAFQDLGHLGILIIGDYTGMIGDPSGRSKTRPQLSYDQIRANAETYKQQVFKILDPARTKIVYNGEWFAKLEFAELLRLASRFTVARLLERDDFDSRLKKGQAISLHEILYPVMQAYDSVMVQADVELGGTDQTFNILLGRHLQEQMGQEPQVGFIVPILTGICGSVRMSKSVGNYIAVAESPQQMFGKTMSIPDALLAEYMRLATDFDEEQIKRIERGLAAGTEHPRDVKFQIARRIVELYHGKEAAQTAASEFESIFKEGKSPTQMPVIKLDLEELEGGKVWIARLLRLAGVATSNQQALQLVRQRAVSIDGKLVQSHDSDIPVTPGMVLKVGKHRFFRIEAK